MTYIDKEVSAWIGQHLDGGFKDENRKTFLKALRDDTDQLKNFIAEHLYDWTTMASAHTGKVVIVNDVEEGTIEVISSLKERFAEEISVLTAEVK